ncbi:MAG: hypothetical protein ACKVOQ_18410 [Cyclobacteriaceae bacterium]
MEVALGILNIILILFLAFWVQKKYASRSVKLYWSAFFLKIIAAISLGLLYKFHYSGGDTWTFYNSATKLSSLAKKDFLEYLNFFFSNHDPSTIENVLYVHDRSALFIKFISIFCLISQDSYWVCALYFGLISFLATWFLYKQVVHFLNDSAKAASVALFFFPSVVFWGSGLVKESLALSGIYFITAIFLKFAYQAKITRLEWLLVLPAMILTWWLKYYWAAIFFVAILTSVVMILIRRRVSLTNGRIVLAWLFLFFLICAGISFAHPNFYMERFLGVLVSNHDQFVAISDTENIIGYYNLQPKLWSVLLNSPWALLSGLFRPLFLDATDILSLPYSIENFILLLLTVSFLFSYRWEWWKPKSDRFKRSEIYSIWLLPILIYCFILCILLAISTPNFGTLSRYRVGFLPFFVFVLIYRNPLLKYLTDRLPFSTK